MRKLLAIVLLFAASPGFAAICSVSEHRSLYMLPNGMVTPMPDKPNRTHSVTYTTSTATSTAFATQTTYIGVSCTATAYYAMATSPTAVATNLIIPADTLVYFPVTAGDKIAFYDGTS